MFNEQHNKNSEGGRGGGGGGALAPLDPPLNRVLNAT